MDLNHLQPIRKVRPRFHKMSTVKISTIVMAPTNGLVDMSKIKLDQSLVETIDEELVDDDSFEDPAEDENFYFVPINDSYVILINNLELS